MKMNKFLNTWKLIVVTLCMLCLSCILLGYSLIGRKAEALSSVPDSTTIEKPIYDFNKYCYDEEQLTRLAQVLMGDSTKKFNDLINFARNNAGTKGMPISNKQITLKYGRYRFSPESIYRNLVWMPVYLSRSNTGDAILTLYLAATSTSLATSQNESAQFSNAGTYSSDYSCTAPSNMYGMSHMRAVQLGNGGDYAFYAADHSNGYQKYTANSITEASCNKFSDFVKGIDFTGMLYEDIVTPSQIGWQEHESYATYVDDSNNYCWPNDAYGSVPTGHVYYYPNYFDYNLQSKVNYNIWQNDKVWLPSLTEVGNGDLDPENVSNSTVNGIWELTNAQRSNVTKSWLRTAATNVAKNGKQYSTYTMFCLAADGSITTGDVNETAATRPAIHLNLSKIANKTVAPINLPSAINVIYDSTTRSIKNASADQLTWYDEKTMAVNYFTDEKLTTRLSPIESGTYYMEVQLRGTDNYFLGEDKLTRRKVTKFIVEKIKLDVEWEYNDDQSPKKVKIVNEESVILPHDKEGSRVPQLGMKYSNTTGAGIQNSPEYPDKMGTYTATAYIIDEDIKNYNYELSGNNITTHKFLVKEKNIPEPYFLADDADYDVDYDGKINKSVLNLSYRGKQYIQIANISQYVEVTVSALNTSLLNTVVDLGVTDGVQTFIVEEVNNYYFTVSLKDDINTQWANSTPDFKDTLERRLTLNLTEALITVSFDGLLNSWESARRLEIGLTIHGVYEDVSNGGLEMRVYYNDPRGIMSNDLERTSSGKYIIPAGLAPGSTYYLVAVMAGGSKKDNYIMDGPKTQKFEIVATVGEFEDEDAKWTYLINGELPNGTSPLFDWNSHRTEYNPYQLTFNEGDCYQFMLFMDESRLKDHYVRAIYSGDLFVTDAGLHCVTVTITGYDKNVTFTDKTYTFWFNIDKKKYDLSDLEWDYEEAFEYTGEEHTVTLKNLDQYQGLTAKYITNGNGINASSYKTVVTLVLSDEYAKNYILPVESDPDSYNGDFRFTIDWEITPQPIVIKWTEKTSSSDIFFIPTLQIGDGYVTYKYQKKSGSSWVDCTTVVAETAPETYRVRAELKAEHANNYRLEVEAGGVDYCEFTVESGKQPVTIGFTVNGTVATDGQQFAFTGSEFEVKPVLNGTVLNYGSFDIEYFRKGSATPLSEAPKNIGSYTASVKNIKLDNAYTVGDTQINFEIVKGEYNASGLMWKYSHGNTVDYVRWDSDAGKWVDVEGKEFVFSAPYDGNEHKIELFGNDDIGLKVADISDNVKKAANKDGQYYTVQLVFAKDDNYNDINLNKTQFPTTLKWRIEKAKIDYSKVQWGYIDEDGEHEFDFENNAFEVKRVDGDFVKYKVGLINLPEPVSKLIKYQTLCLTLVNARKEEGSSYSAVGVYETTFEVFGIIYPGDDNHEGFNGADMPPTIPTFLRWEIKEKELTHPNYDGSWVKFDNREHNLIKLSGIPKEELEYFEVDITFIDNNNKIVNHFRAYNEEADQYIALNAGTYIVRFFEIIEEMTLGDDYSIQHEIKKPFWGQVEIVVEQEALVVIWDKNGSIPVARVKGVYVSNMLETKYTNDLGGEVTDAFIRSTDGLLFYAQPAIKPEFSSDLKFVMADGEVEKISFYSSQYKPTPGVSKTLQKPRIRVEKQEYTGKPINFEIVDWRSTFEKYLYISDGNLTQTEVGKYQVVVSFLKDADAYWDGTENSRIDYVLSFEITEPKTTALDYPAFDKTSSIYTGSPIVFTITNWILLKNYIEFTCDQRLTVTDGVITAVEAGIYDITFKFIEGSNGYWKELENLEELADRQRAYHVQIEITDPTLGVKMILKPTLEFTTANWTGEEIEFRLTNADYYAQFLEITSGSLTNTNPGTYKVVFRIRADKDVTFNDMTTSIELSYTIISKDPGSEVKLKKPELLFYNAQYTGKSITFEINDWKNLYSTYLDILEGSLTKTDIGEYVIVLGFKEGSKAMWEDGTQSVYEIKFYITETPVKDPERLDKPVMESSEMEFTGNIITFKIKDWENLSKYLRIDPGYGDAYLMKTDAGTYTFYVQIKDPTAYMWKDGTTSDVPLTFTIKPASLTVDEIVSGNDGTLDITNGSQDKVNLDEYLEYVYKDKDGNIVDKADLKDGEEYTYTVKVKDDKVEDFYKNIDDAENVLRQLEAKSFTFIYKSSSGISPLLIITISVVGVLIFLVVATIIVLAVKRSQYVDEYVDDYGAYDSYDDYEEDDE